MADLPGVTVMTDASGNAICPVTCSPPLNHRSSGAGFGASGGSRSHLQNSRKLQVVMVIDGKVQKYLRAREMACADVQKVADSLHINLTDAFNQKMAYENIKRQQKQANLQQRMQWMPPAVADAYKQMDQAKNDMSLSDMEYGAKKRQFWGGLSYMDRRQFG